MNTMATYAILYTVSCIFFPQMNMSTNAVEADLMSSIKLDKVRVVSQIHSETCHRCSNATQINLSRFFIQTGCPIHRTRRPVETEQG